MAFLLKAMGFSDSVPNFPFAALDPQSTSSSSSAPYRMVADVTQRHIGCQSNYTVQMVNGVAWTVRLGRATDDKKKLVSIFTCEYGSNGRTAELAKNAMKRAKSLVLPGFLKVHGAADYHDTIHIATDPCIPLKQVLALPAARHYFFSSTYHTAEDTRMGHAEESESFREALALGLRSVAGALNSLHRNHLIHGNVCADTVFVLAGSGAWRLFGLELVSTAADPSSLYYTSAPSLLPSGRVPPEVLQGRRDLIASFPVGHADAWGLGLLIAQSAGVSAAEAAQGRLDDVQSQAGSSGSFLSASQLRDQLPKDLLASFQGLTQTNPQSRMTLPGFLDKTVLLMKSELVQTHTELEEISLRDQGQRERFFDRLNTTLAHFPLRLCLCTLVAKLVESLQTGSVANVVQPIAHIASRLPTPPTAKATANTTGEPSAEVTMADYDFDVYLTPAFTYLYQSTDNLLRYRLLEHAALYAPHVPIKTASEVLWPLFLRGFTSQAASVREYSARALVHLAPRLSPSVLQRDVPQAIAGLQRDADGAIRTNATICLCLLAPHLPEGERGAILLASFCRMLKDPFAPSRLAALRSLATTVKYVDTPALAQTLLPAVCPLTVDTDGQARGSALTIVQSSLERLQSADATRRQQEAANPTAHTTTTATTSTVSSAGPAQADSAGLMTGLSSWIHSATSSTPAPTPAPAQIHTVPSAAPSFSHTDPVPAAAAGKSGWSDDDDDEGGWMSGKGAVGDLFVSSSAQKGQSSMSRGQPASDRTAPPPTNPANADFSSLFDGMTMNHAAQPATATTGGAMKLRGKKSGGLGATRL